jgi:hypothetical protein
MYRRISIFDFDGTIIVNDQENVPDGWRDDHGKIIFNSRLSRKEAEDLISEVRRSKGDDQERVRQALYEARNDKSLSYDDFNYSLFCYMYPGVAWMQDPGSVSGSAALDVVEALHERIRDPQTYVMLVTARNEASSEVVLDRLAEPDVGVSYDDFDEVRFKQGFGSTSQYKGQVANETLAMLDNRGVLAMKDEVLVEVFEDLVANIAAIAAAVSPVEVVGNPGVEIEDSTSRKEERKREVRKKKTNESLEDFIRVFLSQ